MIVLKCGVFSEVIDQSNAKTGACKAACMFEIREDEILRLCEVVSVCMPSCIALHVVIMDFITCMRVCFCSFQG
jgi:hypothetical protein